MGWLSRIFGRAGAVRAEPAGAATSDGAVPVLAVGDDPALALASEMVRAFEGCARVLPDGRIAPYPDAAGVATIGWGSTEWEDGRRVRLTDAPISRDRAVALFGHHLAGFMRQVRAEIPDAAPHEAAAFCSFAYNVGAQGFKASSALRAFRKGDVLGAEAGIELWNKAGGKVLKGLQRRRRCEALVLRGTPFAQARVLADAAYP